MPFTKIPINLPPYKNVDPISGIKNADSLINGYVDEAGNSVMRPGLSSLLEGSVEVLAGWALDHGRVYTYIHAADVTPAVTNPSFEDWTAGDPDGWADSAGHDSEQEATTVHTGTYANRAYDSNGGATTYVEQDGIIGSFASKKMIVNAYGRSVADDHHARLDFSEQGEAIQSNVYILVTTAWTRMSTALTGTVDCGSDAVLHDLNIKFYPASVNAAAVGKSIIDNIKLYSAISTDTLNTITNVTCDGTMLTSRSSVGDVESNPGSYYNDTGNKHLYIHTPDSTDPAGHTIKINSIPERIVQGDYWWESRQVVIFVVAGRIYKITDSSGTWVDITGDELNYPGGRVYFATDGKYLVMANGGRMVYTDGTNITKYVINPNAPTKVSRVAYIDGYILASEVISETAAGTLDELVTGPNLRIGETKKYVAHDAFRFVVKVTGLQYTKTADVAGFSPPVETIPQNKWGAWAFDIGADLTIDKYSAGLNTTGYDTEQEAIDDLPEPLKGHVRMGHVTVFTTDEDGFVGGTTYFDATGVTANFESEPPPTKTGNFVFFSEELDGSQSSLAFQLNNRFVAEANPDGISGVAVVWRRVYVPGSLTIEQFWNDGETPFARSGAVIQRGVIAPDTFIEAGDRIFFLDSGKRLVSLFSEAPEFVSTPFDRYIQGFTTVSDAICDDIVIEGRTFLLITFPTEDITLVYDYSQGHWAEWGYWDAVHGVYKRFRGNCHCYAKAWDMHIIGDFENGKIYELKTDVYQDDGDDIRFFRRTAHINHDTDQRKKSKELIIRAKSGHGENGNSPQMTIRWRDDGKNKWSNAHVVDLRKVGVTDFIARFHRLGIYRTRQYEISYADNAPFVLVGMEENVELLG